MCSITQSNGSKHSTTQIVLQDVIILVRQKLLIILSRVDVESNFSGNEWANSRGSSVHKAERSSAPGHHQIIEGGGGGNKLRLGQDGVSFLPRDLVALRRYSVKV